MGTYTLMPGQRAFYNGRPLPPRNELINHSPDGFNWGYEGSGPAQLALAVISNEIGDKLVMADPGIYQMFKREVIAGIPQDSPYQFTSVMVKDWLKRKGISA